MEKSKARAIALRLGFRSGLEKDTAAFLKKMKVKFTYEEDKILWEDYKLRTYTPDFILDNGIIIETKGRFVSADRRKHKEIKKQYPNLDIRFVFSNSRARLYKGAKSSYADWCEKEGFLYSDKTIPEEWITEENKE